MHYWQMQHGPAAPEPPSHLPQLAGAAGLGVLWLQTGTAHLPSQLLRVCGCSIL